MNKASLLVKNDTVTFGIPITKSNINVEKRMVSGWATVDNVDQMGDEVTADASWEAFSMFRGNVREMHDNIAVGKVVNFEQRDFYHEDGTKGRGVYVDVYVSKGAESTWQKVLDGTLSAFSIKGPILPGGRVTEYRESIGKVVNKIQKYRLTELSLVDNPGNELCNVLSIQKVNDGLETAGMATDLDLTNVYWCDHDKVAIISKQESANCHECSQPMDNTGWFEQVDGEDPQHSIQKILRESGKILEKKSVVEGGLAMEDDKKETVEEVTKVEEPTTTEEVEKVQEPSLEKINTAVQSIKDALAGLQQTGEGHASALDEVKKSVTDVKDEVEKSLVELQAKHDELSKRFADLKTGFEEVSKRLDDVEKGEAVQKSLTVEKQAANTGADKKQQGFWSSTFLPESFD